MKRIKKGRPEVAPSRQPRPGLAPGTIHANIIAHPGEIASPNLDGGGGALPMSWALLLTSIGTGWLVSRLFQVIDWIERR